MELVLLGEVCVVSLSSGENLTLSLVSKRYSSRSLEEDYRLT